MRAILAALALAGVLLLLQAIEPAGARDVGQFGTPDPAIHEWFRGISNQLGQICCDEADGFRINDPDWRIEGDGYAINVKGKWEKIPPELLVKTPNKIGVAVVWLYPPDAPQIRCFMPGATG